METVQIVYNLKNVKSFIGLFPSDLLPHSITQSGTVIINADPHTEKGLHWLAIHLQRRSYSANYFDSYGIAPFIPNIIAFLRRTCTVWKFNTIQLQGLTSAVCCKYCCLFAHYMDRGYTPKQFVGLFNPDIADRQINQLFASEFGPLPRGPRGGQCSSNIYKRYVTIRKLIILNLYIDPNGGSHRLRFSEGTIMT